MTYKSEKIVIIGGGSAGWITAATLIKTYPKKDIVLIESANIPTIGVGESTVSEFGQWLDYLDIDYKDFMKFSNAAFKFGVGFTNFKNIDSGTYYFTFGKPDLSNTLMERKDWQFLKALNPDVEYSDYSRYYYPQTRCLDTNKVVLNNINELHPFIPKRDVMFQIDASRFALWLAEEYSIPKGVKRITGTVVNVNGNEDGVLSVTLEDGQQISGDLFVDCSGFKSLLLGGFIKEKFVSTLDYLPNNKAWFAPIQYTNKNVELTTFTNCTALKNGWTWYTPLWSRIGSGYSYSDKYITDEDALQEFKDHLNSKAMPVYDPNRSDKMEFRKVETKNGYYEKSWVKNVVAIGLSSGFLEPLEGTGLMFIHIAAIKLANVISNGTYTQWGITDFNNRIKETYKETIDFVILHYALSHRDDTKYWKDITSKNYEEKFYSLIRSYYDFNGLGSVALGLGERSLFLSDLKELSLDYNLNLINGLEPYFNMRKEKINIWNSIIDKQPSHYEYLKNFIYNEN